MSDIKCKKCGGKYISESLPHNPLIEQKTESGHPIVVSLIWNRCTTCEHSWTENKVVGYHKLECTKSPSGKHHWKTQTSKDEDRTIPRGDWGLIIGTFCIYCEKKRKV